MSRCVPNWDVDDNDTNAAHPSLNFLSAATGSASAAPTPPGPDLSSVDYEVAELTWENGRLSMHCLGQSRLNSKPTATIGTLESLVNQATTVCNDAFPPAAHKPSFACAAELVPWFHPSQGPTDVTASASATMTMDVLVPCTTAAGTDDPHRHPVWMLGESVAHGTRVCGCGSTHMGSCSTLGGGNGLLNPGEEEPRQEGSRKRTCCGSGDLGDHHSVIGSATCCHPVTSQDTYDSSERELENAMSQGSPENMSCGKGGEEKATAAATKEEHNSVYSRPQREAEEKRRLGKSSLSTRRSRAAAIHNQSERKRRNKINQRMKTLQKLLPNSSKTDKASVLDEVIDYLKQLQAQVQMMSRMNVPVPPIMLPLTMQQQLQLSMMAPMGLGLGLAGMPGVLAGDMSGLGGNHPNIPGIPPSPAILHPFMPVAPWDGTPGDRFPSGPTAAVMPDPFSTFLASQSSPAMTLDAYSRLAAMYQQHMRQQQPSNPNN